MNEKGNSMSRTRLRLLSCVLPVVLMAGTASAFPAPEQPGSANPAQAQKQFQEKLQVPTVVPHIQVQETGVQAAPKGAGKIKLKLADIQLTGVTVYKPGQLAPLYKDKIGKIITLADVYDIAAALTRKYRNDGFILTQVVVPPQTIEGGHVKLQVVEGFIGKIEIQGTDSPSAVETVRAYAAHVRSSGRALNVKELERALLLINDLPGLQAHGVLSPSKTTVGAADLTIVMEKRKPYDAKIGVDDYGSKFLGPWQLTAAASLNSVFGHNERITAQIVDAPNGNFSSELLYGGLDYEQPIFDSGLTFELFTNDTSTNPGFTLDQFDVRGNSFLAGGRLKYPFIRTRALTDTGRITLDYNDVDTSDNIEPDKHDRIRSVRVGNKIEYLDTFFGAGYNVFDVEGSHGLDIFGARPSSATNISRADATPDYSKVGGEAQRLQRLTDNLNLLTAVNGQWSGDNLYTSEEFGIGGTSYGRGYDPSEILGDSGIAGKLELQWNDPIQFSPLFKNQFFAFYDLGRVWTNNATTAAEARASLASTGFGVRSTIDKATDMGLMVGFPLTKPVATRGDNSPRVFFGLYHKF